MNMVKAISYGLKVDQREPLLTGRQHSVQRVEGVRGQVLDTLAQIKKSATWSILTKRPTEVVLRQAGAFRGKTIEQPAGLDEHGIGSGVKARHGFEAKHSGLAYSQCPQNCGNHVAVRHHRVLVGDSRHASGAAGGGPIKDNVKTTVRMSPVASANLSQIRSEGLTVSSHGILRPSRTQMGRPVSKTEDVGQVQFFKTRTQITKLVERKCAYGFTRKNNVFESIFSRIFNSLEAAGRAPSWTLGAKQVMM